MKEELIAPLERLIEREEKLDSLCGEVLATLRLNLQRGHLRFREESNDTEIFSKWLDQWEESYRNITKGTS